jgi:hypothetical protein
MIRVNMRGVLVVSLALLQLLVLPCAVTLAFSNSVRSSAAGRLSEAGISKSKLPTLSSSCYNHIDRYLLRLHATNKDDNEDKVAKDDTDNNKGNTDNKEGSDNPYLQNMRRSINDDAPNNQDTSSTTNKETDSETKSILQRFVSPQIADPGLPIADVLVAQIIAPSVQLAWLISQGAPRPSWLQPLLTSSAELFTAPRGSLLAPLLIHGAALASCWLLGALAAQAYRVEAIAKVPSNTYWTVLWTIVKAGAFATGLLVLGTQIDLYKEYGGYVEYGSGSPEVDFRLLLAAVEVVNDVFFEAIVLIPWRLWVAQQNERDW